MSEQHRIVIITRGIREIWANHGTKVIGYVTMGAGAIAVMDPHLVTETFGPHAMQWALVITGISAAVRGHTNKIQAVSQQ